MLISKANKKTRIESFNINNTICKKINGCKAQNCFKHCYYNKIKRIYPQQTPFLNKNLKISKSKDFVALINYEISNLNIKYFRIHSCGEFYSQEYFNKWCLIAQSNPDITFFTYTKNIDLDVSRPSNFILYLSDDKSIWKQHYNKFDGVSRVKNKNEELPKGFTQCLNQTKGLSCLQCKLCIKGNKTNICFNKH